MHVRIEGRVQGVGFRNWMLSVAVELGIGGWVRNRHDGAVESIISGPSAAVETMLERCRIGPAYARVSRLEIIGEGGGAFRSFEIRSTV